MGAHRGKALAELATRRVLLPPYSPELNPAERVFEETRQRAEGRAYDTLQAKRDGVEQYLTALAAGPDRAKQLRGWARLHDALTRLPQRSAA